MAAGDNWFDCTNIKKILGLDQILRLLVVDDGFGNPAINTYEKNYSTVSINPTALTDNTAHELMPQISDKSNYITDLLVTNSHATVGTIVEIRETDASGKLLFHGYAGPAGGGFAMPGMKQPIKGSTNTKLVVICLTNGSNVIISANGYSN